MGVCLFSGGVFFLFLSRLGESKQIRKYEAMTVERNVDTQWHHVCFYRCLCKARSQGDETCATVAVTGQSGRNR